MKPGRFAMVAMSVLLTVLVGAGAADATPPGNHGCLAPDGTNLNELLGIRGRILGPPACREALAGERWVRSAPGWAAAASAGTAVYPAGYTPRIPDPIDDFNAKFVQARFIQDRGTAQEKTFTFGREVLRTGFVGSDGLPFSAFASPVFAPLSIGQHTHTMFITMSAEHCDGLGTERDLNCIPGGTIQWTGDVPIVFVPRTPG